MKIFVKTLGEVELNQSHFIASGGEGKIYGKGNVAYKLYEDYAKMIPLAKMQELSVLDKPNIIKPELLILDSSNKPIGYTMKLVKNTSAMCQLFTKAFKQRNNLTNETILKLIKDLQDTINYIHNKNILIVDLNELNFLVDNKFDKIYAIDVNSYQTPSFPATVIMESIKDRHCNNKFTTNTDWFSFGIISFQLLIGIHPYKGNHPNFENLSVDERLNARMVKNVSVFHNGSTIPKICQPFDAIPSALKQWYLSIFEKGDRTSPPTDYITVINIVLKPQQIKGNNVFEIIKLETFDNDVLRHVYHEGNRIIFTKNKIIINNKSYDWTTNNTKITFAPKTDKPILAYIENKELKLYNLADQENIPITSKADDIIEYNGRIYIKNNNNILELNLKETNKIHPSLKQVGTVLDLPTATNMFDGVIIQNLLGRHFASIFPETNKCYQINIKELDNFKIIDAKFENQILGLTAVKAGKYSRFVMRLSQDYSKYDIREEANIIHVGINFSVADHGICALITEDDKLEAFSNAINGNIKVLDDPVIDGEMKLSHEGSKIVFTKDNELYSISLRK